jgi:hypothetical protein
MHPSHPLEPIAAQVAPDLVLIRVVRELTWLIEKWGPVPENSVRLSGPLLLDSAAILRERDSVRAPQVPGPDLAQPLPKEATLDSTASLGAGSRQA